MSVQHHHQPDKNTASVSRRWGAQPGVLLRLCPGGSRLLPASPPGFHSLPTGKRRARRKPQKHHTRRAPHETESRALHVTDKNVPDLLHSQIWVIYSGLKTLRNMKKKIKRGELLFLPPAEPLCGQTFAAPGCSLQPQPFAGVTEAGGTRGAGWAQDRPWLLTHGASCPRARCPRTTLPSPKALEGGERFAGASTAVPAPTRVTGAVLPCAARSRHYSRPRGVMLERIST